MRRIAAAGAVTAGMVAIWAAASFGGPEGPGELPPVPAIDRIAFVTPAGQVRTMAIDGSEVRNISPPGDGQYAWPAWSPDGQLIVYSKLIGQGEGRARLRVLAADLDSNAARSIHSVEIDPPEDTGPYSYFAWSPDGTHLAFIVGTGPSASLMLSDLRNPAAAREILTGGAIWPSWSGDSRHLLIHREREIMLVNLDSEGAGGGYRTDSLDVLAERHRAAPWSPANGRFALVARDGGGDHAVVLADPSGAMTRVDRAPFHHAALSFSPDGTHLAVYFAGSETSYMGREIMLGEGLRLYDGGGGATNLGVGDLMIAMFWSPAGDMIAYVTAPDDRGVLSWRLYDVAANESRPLADFIPSGPQLSILTYFDQFALSHSPWTHDGRHLVFSGRLIDDNDRKLGDRVIVLPIDGPEDARAVAQGIMAVPSPR